MLDKENGFFFNRKKRHVTRHNHECMIIYNRLVYVRDLVV